MEMVEALETFDTTTNVKEMGEEIMMDVVELCMALLRNKLELSQNSVTDDNTKTNYKNGLEEREYSQRVENKIEKLRMKWVGREYEIVLEKLEMPESWRTEMDGPGVKEVIRGRGLEDLIGKVNQ